MTCCVRPCFMTDIEKFIHCYDILWCTEQDTYKEHQICNAQQWLCSSEWSKHILCYFPFMCPTNKAFSIYVKQSFPAGCCIQTAGICQNTWTVNASGWTIFNPKLDLKNLILFSWTVLPGPPTAWIFHQFSRNCPKFELCMSGLLSVVNDYT